ncbi:phenylalanine--tRNA ligase subunit alpha [Arcanobacterium hippocoleae]|uniref:Phenylalanine--tRNA ligase alpha subunit n=1 Tax=Arcanobacterium hippocoleae TaxID=149017 RepID=A0ABU1T0K9_9ACTO|nr:phenylalanine--tRNA ligase subunit alpha [Arcanobacterium hippocoleae]MDR6938904.1 phenylalanyl-tRNA synthetase alpha chain [Arcanobacterium hippocoleae]
MALSPLDEAGIAQAVAAAQAAFAAANTLNEIKTARLAHVGDNAPITHANMQIRNLQPSEKPIAGKLIGGARKAVQEALALATSRIEAQLEAKMLREERVDVTIPTSGKAKGARHPLDVLIDDVSDFFIGMGWDIAEGPELEHEWFNFDALNFGPDHPARQMQDTFYVAGYAQVTLAGEANFVETPGLVMRTHTSPVQSHVMLERGAPVYIACPGKVYRTDALDATHTPVFHQVEGLAVDKGITMEHLKGTLDHFAKAMFGPEAKTRLRPSYFPFTEPSAEMDLWFPQKKGGAGWIEWGGCGVVNPEVLKNAGIDPDVYTGIAFGMGLERTLMLRHGIADMRDMVEGDIRFSTQFGTTGRGN